MWDIYCMVTTVTTTIGSGSSSSFIWPVKGKSPRTAQLLEDPPPRKPLQLLWLPLP